MFSSPESLTPRDPLRPRYPQQVVLGNPLLNRMGSIYPLSTLDSGRMFNKESLAKECCQGHHIGHQGLEGLLSFKCYGRTVQSGSLGLTY